MHTRFALLYMGVIHNSCPQYTLRGTTYSQFLVLYKTDNLLITELAVLVSFFNGRTRAKQKTARNSVLGLLNGMYRFTVWHKTCFTRVNP
jgi:hypothetical protein